MSNGRVIKAGIGYTIGNFFLKGFTFLTVPIFARLLSTEDFGIYNTFIAYETILFIIQGCAIHTSYNSAKLKYTVKNLNGEGLHSYSEYVSASIMLIICNTIGLLIMLIPFGKCLQSALDLTHVQLILLILYSFSTAIVTCFNTDASLNYDYKRYLLVAGVNAISNLMLSIILVLTVFSSRRYMGRILGTVIPMVIIAVILVVYFFRTARPKYSKQYLKWGLSYSIPIIFHGLSQVILSQFDRIMIKRMVGNSEVGIYSFAYTIFSIINVIFTSLGTVWTPWFYEQMSKGERERIKTIGTYYAVGILLLSIEVMLVCPELVLLLGTSKYADASYCAIPIIASGVFVFLFTLPSSIEYYYEKTGYIAIGTMAAAGINVILNYYCIGKYGYVAAAYTTLFTYILYFVFHLIISRRIAGEFIFSNKMILLSSVVAIVAMILSLQMMGHPLLRWGLSILIAGVAIIYEERRFGIIGENAARYIKRIKNEGNDS